MNGSVSETIASTNATYLVNATSFPIGFVAVLEDNTDIEELSLKTIMNRVTN